jgi:aspartyl-tRNA(Asn)/glutamyl-tRNA(Gln) amidotransferase subunit C
MLNVEGPMFTAFIQHSAFGIQHFTSDTIPSMSTTFSGGDVERVARLARLELTADEKNLFARQLSEILAYAEQIQRVPTEGVEPTSHAGDAAAMRDDVVRPSLPREASLSAGPDADQSAGLFKVPRVLG